MVADAREDGIDLKVAVIGKNPPVETPLRDIATGVDDAYPGSTVLVLNPSYAGTYPHLRSHHPGGGPGCGQYRRRPIH